MKNVVLSLLAVALVTVLASDASVPVAPGENLFWPNSLCGWMKLPHGYIGNWTREPHDPARPLQITFQKSTTQPGFYDYILSRAGTTRTYIIKMDAEWRDERRWFTLDPTHILLEKKISGSMYEERMSLEPNGLLRIAGQDEIQTFNFTLRRL